MRKLKICNPAGNWGTDDIIGSKCRILGIPSGYEMCGDIDSDSEFTISGVIHRVLESGRVNVVYELLEFPGKLFRASEIQVTKINSNNESE